MKKTILLLASWLLLLASGILSAQTGITCNPNTFFSIVSGSGVEELQITGSTVTSNGLVVTNAPPGPALGICNNLNGGTFSPTFYSNVTMGLGASDHDGTAWVYTAATAGCTLSNAGGYGNFLYYNVANSLPACMNKYDGTTFTQIWSDPVMMFTVADVAVDAVGNAWTFAGTSSTITDSILVISPAGQLIKSFAFSMNTLNGYGCFLLNGVLYLGLGGLNPNYPNTLIPITFTATSATAGIPIPFGGSADIASCTPGLPLAIEENNASSTNQFDFAIQPSITSDYIKCLIRSTLNDNMNIYITDVLGKIIYSHTIEPTGTSTESVINVNTLSKGIYSVQVYNGKEKIAKKFVKK